MNQAKSNEDIVSTRHRHRILIVDDDKDILEALSDMLSIEGDYTVETAADAFSARRLIDSFAPDLALLDVQLGHTSGLDLIGNLQRRVHDVVCIMMTAHRDVDYAVEAIKQGAREHLFKPLNPETLLKTIDRHLKIQARDREQDQTKQNLDTVMRQASQFLFLLDIAGRIQEVGQAALSFFGLTREEVIGKEFWEMPWWAESNRKTQFIQSSVLAAKEGNQTSFDVDLAGSTGKSGCFDFTVKPVLGHDDNQRRILVEGFDVTTRKQTELQLEQLAHSDPLTGLPNRSLFDQHLSTAIALASRYNRQLAVLFLDLDNFKQVNDTRGHQAGDDMLVKLSSCIWGILREEDTIARLSGDEFGIILREISTPEVIDIVVNRILKEIESVSSTADDEQIVTGSIGISIYPDDGNDGLSLLKNADKAMYRAKASGKNSYRFYSHPGR